MAFPLECFHTPSRKNKEKKGTLLMQLTRRGSRKRGYVNEKWPKLGERRSKRKREEEEQQIPRE